MDDDSRDDAVSPPPGSRDVVRQEARHVIDEQLQTLRNTDRKALETARIIGIILGLIVSALSIAEQPARMTNSWILSGGALLLGSLCLAVLTYTVDRPSYGIGPGYIDTTIRELDSKNGLEDDLLARYADWIDDNGNEITTNGIYLFATQWTFLLGLLAIAIGVLRLV